MHITNPLSSSIALACVALLSPQVAEAQTRLYVRAAPELARSSVEHTKKVTIDGGSSSSSSSATGVSVAATLAVGVERALAARWWLTGEFEGAISATHKVEGTIFPTTSGEVHDVWPGRWELADEFGVGANLRMTRMLGSGATRGYALVGVRRMRTEVATGGTNPETGVFGEDRQHHTTWPWTAGVGVQVGDSPIDLRIRYFRSVLDWVIELPEVGLDYRYATSGLAFSVGWVLAR